MTFPTAGAQVYYNEAGEPTGWDYPDEGPDPDDYDPYDYDEPDDEEEEEEALPGAYTLTIVRGEREEYEIEDEIRS